MTASKLNWSDFACQRRRHDLGVCDMSVNVANSLSAFFSFLFRVSFHNLSYPVKVLLCLKVGLCLPVSISFFGTTQINIRSSKPPHTQGLVGVSSHNVEGVVEAERFGLLLFYFGPLEQNMVSRMMNLAQQSYFHGFCSSDHAKCIVFSFSLPSMNILIGLLSNQPSGHYMVRFSSNRWGQVIISVKQKNVVHLIVQNVGTKFRFHQAVDKWWSDIHELVIDHSQEVEKWEREGKKDCF